MARKGHYGNGTIAPSGKSTWRIRYRIEGERHRQNLGKAPPAGGAQGRRRGFPCVLPPHCVHACRLVL